MGATRTQPKRCGLLPFPTDQICRQTQRKFLGDNSHHYQARHFTADNHRLLRAEEYTKHPPFRLNGQSNQSPSRSTTAWINRIPCPWQAQMPRQEQMLKLSAQGSPKAAAVAGPALCRCSRLRPQEPAGHTGSQFLGLLTAATGPVPSPAASGKNCPSPCGVSLQHISFWNQVTWACKSMDARAREMGRNPSRFSLFSECICQSGHWETRRSLFPWLVSCNKSDSMVCSAYSALNRSVFDCRKGNPTKQLLSSLCTIKSY